MSDWGRLTDWAIGLLVLGGFLQYPVFWSRASRTFFFGTYLGVALWGLTLIPSTLGMAIIFVMDYIERQSTSSVSKDVPI